MAAKYTNSSGMASSGFQAYDEDTGALVGRTLQEGTNITITNADGVAGNPVINASSGGIVTSSFLQESDCLGPQTSPTDTIYWTMSGMNQSGVAHQSGHPGIYRYVASSEIYCGFIDTASGDLTGLFIVQHNVAVAAGVLANGFTDEPETPASISNGIYFRSATGDTNWMACTENGGTVTATDTGIVINSSDWRNQKIVVEDAGATAKFYIDGVLKATNTTNMPSTTLGMSFVAGSSAGPTSAYLDYLGVHQNLVR